MVDHGATSSFSVRPANGYYIASKTVDGSPVSVGSTSGQTISFTNVQATYRITANFAIKTFNITASTGADGAISPTKSLSVNYGGNQTFNITANTGYYIVDVVVNGGSVGAVNVYTFNNCPGCIHYLGYVCAFASNLWNSSCHSHHSNPGSCYYIMKKQEGQN
jgi:hypothetical protein